MKYLLDTNICVYLLRGKHPVVANRVREHSAEGIAVSTVAVAELRYGTDKSAQPEHNHSIVSKLLMPLEILDFDSGAADAYGRIRAELEQRGTPIGSLDMLIGAHAVSQNLILVTHNTSEFSRIPGLQIEDWALESS